METLKVMGVIFLIALLVAGVGIGYIVYQAQGIQDITIEDIEIGEPRNITTSSFTIDVSIFIRNPSGLTVPIESLSYNIVLKNTEEQIGTGSTPPFKINKRSTTKIPLTQTFTFEQQMALQLAQQPSVLAVMKIEATAKLSVIETTIPFEIEVDIKPYVDQYIQNLQQQAQGQIPEGINIEDFQGNIPQLP